MQPITTSNPLRSLWFYLVTAFMLLMSGLAVRSLWESESRWAEISRNIVLTGDWFHPAINGHVYFDKPVMSYWWIVMTQWITGSLNEFAIRLPSVMAAAIVLWASFDLSQRLWNRQIAWLSVWLLLTCYGFLFWTHTASADMANVAFIMLAVAWFFRFRESHVFTHYLGFWLICGIGAQMKGLTAFVIPVLVLLPWLLREKRLLQHSNWAHAFGAAIGIGVFLAPYIGAALLPLPEGYTLPQHHLSGLDLVIRENIVRFFKPFDHMDPIYSYLYHVPRLLLPWAFLFLAALIEAIRRYRSQSVPQRWLLESIVLIFAFFTLSGSRRWYYILPIIPFCCMLISHYLLEAPAGRGKYLAQLMTLFLLLFGALLVIASPWVFELKDLPVSTTLWVMSVALALLLPLLWFFRRRVGTIMGQSHWSSQLSLMIAGTVLLMLTVYSVTLPFADSFRHGKEFALSVKQGLRPDDRLAFYQRADNNIVFYLGQSYGIPELENLVRASLGDTTILIVEQRNLAAFHKRFPQLDQAEPLAQQPGYAWKGKRPQYLFTAWRLP